MSEQQYPDYVYRMLAEAREVLAEDDFTTPDTAAICYEILALFPDCQEAADLVLEAFNDPWVIRDSRKAVGRLIDEWDDREWQQRRRLALSFHSMCRWEGQYREYDETLDPEDFCPSDVKEMLDEGHGQLLQDYLLGEKRGSEMAWPIFQEAIRRTNRPRAAMLWVADEYANKGFFVEAVEVLEQLLAEFPKDQEARRYWAEVRWWRDNQERIPWIPPKTSGDGRRFRQRMRQVDPEFAANEEAYMRPLEYMPPDMEKLPEGFELPEPIQAELIARIEEALSELEPAEIAYSSRVDWSYLDKIESGDVSISDFPAWAQYLLLDIDDPDQLVFMKHYLLEYFSNPPLPEDEDDGHWAIE